MIRRLRRERERRALERNNIVCSEGRLGGYVRSSETPAPSGLDVRHGDPQTYTPELWRWAVERLRVRSVLDVGCGEGHAAGFFRELGCDVLAVDGSPQARRDSVVPDVHVLHDFSEGAYLPERTFDLVWSCEFVEHVEERYAENFLESFASAETVMMTHALPGQPGWHHVNCQTADYWIRRLADHGFRYDEALTLVSRSVAGRGHYGGSGLFFRKRGAEA